MLSQLTKGLSHATLDDPIMRAAGSGLAVYPLDAVKRQGVTMSI